MSELVAFVRAANGQVTNRMSLQLCDEVERLTEALLRVRDESRQENYSDPHGSQGPAITIGGNAYEAVVAALGHITQDEARAALAAGGAGGGRVKTLRILDAAIPGLDESFDRHAGRYIKSFLVDVADHPLAGLRTCESYDDALKFDSTEEAIAFWQQQSEVVPVRDDGRPNRPLTLFTVTIE